MNDLSDFVSSVLEFLVGGLLFTCSVLFLVVGVVGVPAVSTEDLKWLAQSQLLVLVGLALAYAMGVVAEGFARAAFEFLLDRVTVRRPEFADGAPTAPSAPSAPSAETRRRGWRSWRARAAGFTLGRGYTPAQCAAAVAARERQRARVMTLHVALHGEVQGQLKRLRLERVFALSLAITAVSFVLRHDVGYAVAVAACAAVMVGLVNARFKRYCGAIARAYRLVEDEKLVQPAAGASAETAQAATGPS